MTDQEYAAAAVAHLDEQLAAARDGAARLQVKATRFAGHAAAVADQAAAADDAVAALEVERQEWATKAAGAAPPVAAERVAGSAGVAEGTGEAGL